jgi:hypothetical protein
MFSFAAQGRDVPPGKQGLEQWLEQWLEDERRGRLCSGLGDSPIGESAVNPFVCDQCGRQSDDKAIIIRFSYQLADGTPGVELFYLCQDCDSLLPKKNPVRRSKLVQIFTGLYPNRKLLPEADKSSG